MSGGSSADWLSDEWFELVHEMASDADGVGVDGTLSGRVQCEIIGGPRRGVSFHWTLEQGRLVSGGSGRADSADVTVTLPWDDAVAIQQGEADPSVAFMQGRLKVNGSMGLMATLLARARTPDCRTLLQRVSAVSRF